MRLRPKTFLVTGFVFLATMLIGQIYTRTLFIQGFLNIERQEITKNVQRLQYILDHEITELGSLTNDWAAWDDSYDFALNREKGFVETNLLDSTFSELGLNFIIYLDSEGSPFFQKAFDLDDNVEIPVDGPILSYLTELSQTIPQNKTAGDHQGIFAHDDLPVIFAARPILSSRGQGNPRGLLIFGKTIEGALLDHIRLSADTDLKILPYNSNEFFDLPASPHDPEFRINLRQKDTAQILSLVRDYGGNPVFMIEQTMPRSIYLQGIASGREFMGGLFIGSMVASLIVMFALEFGFLRRISRLMDGVEHFKNTNLAPDRMLLKGKDEIASLSGELHRTLSLLADTQKDLATHFDFEKLLVRISTKFINLPVEEIDEGINRLLKVIGDFLDMDRMYVLLLKENDRSKADMTHEWTADGISSCLAGQPDRCVASADWWFETLEQGHPIAFDDIRQLPGEARAEMAACLQPDTLSLAALPILIGGRLVGLMGLESVHRKTEWGEQTILLLEVIASVVANAIDRSRHERLLITNQMNMAGLNELTRASISKTSLDSACRAISTRLVRLLNCDEAFLFIRGETREVKGYRNGRKAAIDASHLALINQYLQSSEPVPIHAADFPNAGFRASFHKALGKTALLVPLAIRNIHLGGVLFSFRKVHTFTQDEILFSQQSASQITLSIMKTIALESARRKSGELGALRATIADITSELDLSRLLHTMLERAIRLVRAEGGDFCRVDEKTGDLEVVACINIAEEYVGTRIRFDEGASGKVIATKKALMLDDYSTWEGRLDVFGESNIRSTIVLPLMIGERVLGTLGIFHINPDHHFTTDDRQLLNLFAQHATIAMQNALLFEQIQKMARMDDITGLYNRRAFKEMGDYEVIRARRKNHPVALAMIDLDNFKLINDRYSHQVGDEVLREFARICRETLRNIDIMGRYGGDEAVILMPETDAEAALNAMERLRDTLEHTPITINGQVFSLTASIGIATYHSTPPELTEIMDQADKCLYIAKKDGKNCVRINTSHK